ncbi:MAG: peptidoglycan recognition protein family protein [Telluria sp.]
MSIRTRLACSLAVLAMAAGCTTAPVAPLAGVEQRIVTVAEWGGTPTDPAEARPHTIDHITLHHQGEAFPQGKDPRAYLRTLQGWSRTAKGWADIPYHYVIDLDGVIYAARDINLAGDTNTSYDPKGHALIEVVGNFEEVQPNSKQLDAVVDLMALLADKYKVPVERIHGHKDYAETACPGVNMYRYLENGYFHQRVKERLKAAK